MLHPSDFSPRFPRAADAPDNAETGAKEFGSRLGPYEVVSLLGAGGMGEVYRARDTKLNRDVALKILPDAFAIDGDRIARFRREAQVLASLNPPNIAAIYGFEDSGSAHALVLELVDGPTLADRIAKGAIPFDEAQIEDVIGTLHQDNVPVVDRVSRCGSHRPLRFARRQIAVTLGTRRFECLFQRAAMLKAMARSFLSPCHVATVSTILPRLCGAPSSIS